jgi:hypothetical protein
MLGRTAIILCLCLGVVSQVHAQRALRGTVAASNGPVVGANVFLLETLEGALSDSAGHWSFTTSHTGIATLIVRAA